MGSSLKYSLHREPTEWMSCRKTSLVRSGICSESNSCLHGRDERAGLFARHWCDAERLTVPRMDAADTLRGKHDAAFQCRKLQDLLSFLRVSMNSSVICSQTWVCRKQLTISTCNESKPPAMLSACKHSLARTTYIHILPLNDLQSTDAFKLLNLLLMASFSSSSILFYFQFSHCMLLLFAMCTEFLDLSTATNNLLWDKQSISASD